MSVRLEETGPGSGDNERICCCFYRSFMEMREEDAAKRQEQIITVV
jgi:hypothetical protein